MRFVPRFSVALIISLLPVLPAVARERLVMPFDCGVERGEVRLTPSGEASYPIVGIRDEQTITTCPKGEQASCRTVMVHRFAVSCRGTSVAWMQVAAAIRSAASNRAWIEDGRLNLVMPARDSLDAPRGCLAGGHGGLQHQVTARGNCLPVPRKAAFEHLILPDGFAPVGELGARLMIGGAADDMAADGDAAASLDGNVHRVAMTDGEIAVAKADPEAVLEPAGRAFETALEPDLANDEWITVVHAGPDEVPAAEPPAPAPDSFWSWLVAGLAASVIVLLLGVRYVPAALARSRGASAFHMARSDMNLSNASQAVAALLLQTETAASDLRGAGPLRDVLQAELKHVRERLASLDKILAKGGLPAEKSAAQFRALVRELERIRRIVDSAVASLASTRKPATLPRTTSEAYEVLGVNAEVSENVLKKIVDALRMSWHPDLARDDNDREMRESRIRQINIAWDLINGKREAA